MLVIRLFGKNKPLSHVATKPTKWVCDQHGFRPACASAQSDQDPCCSLSDLLLVIGLVSEQHGSWSDCADAQAGLDPCWSQTHNIGFVMTRLIYIVSSTCINLSYSQHVHGVIKELFISDTWQQLGQGYS
jgi:hypothetical protein